MKLLRYMTQSLNNSNKEEAKTVFIKYLYPFLRMRKIVAPTRLVKYWRFHILYANTWNVNLCEEGDERRRCLGKQTRLVRF